MGFLKLSTPCCCFTCVCVCVCVCIQCVFCVCVCVCVHSCFVCVVCVCVCVCLFVIVCVRVHARTHIFFSVCWCKWLSVRPERISLSIPCSLHFIVYCPTWKCFPDENWAAFHQSQSWQSCTACPLHQQTIPKMFLMWGCQGNQGWKWGFGVLLRCRRQNLFVCLLFFLLPPHMTICDLAHQKCQCNCWRVLQKNL